jgi:predicted DNA-binding protein YlxM (UPF0122 family)
MAKISDKQWAKAKLLYENGNSLRKIAAETEINHQTINDRAKKEGWNPDRIRQQVIEQTRVETHFLTLEKNEQEFVRSEVDKQIKMLEFFNNSTLRNCSIMMKKVNSDTDFYGHNSVQNTLLKGKETCFGKMPDTVITNTNAQQTNKQKKVIFEVIGGTTRST